jgi:hypothetical protein
MFLVFTGVPVGIPGCDSRPWAGEGCRGVEVPIDFTRLGLKIIRVALKVLKKKTC